MKGRTIIGSSNYTSGYLPEESKNTSSEKKCASLYSLQHYSQEPRYGNSHEKEQNLAMDRPGRYYAKWNTSKRERQMLYTLSYMWNLKQKHQPHRYREETGICQRWDGRRVDKWVKEVKDNTIL